MYLDAWSQLLGALLDLLPGTLDLGVLGLDVAVLRGRSAALSAELGVGPLQLVLPRLQFSGQPLRLVQQRVGARVGDHRVDVDPDGLHPLPEEVPVHLGERPQRPGLDDAEDLVFKDDRHDHHVDRPALPIAEEIRAVTSRDVSRTIGRRVLATCPISDSPSSAYRDAGRRAAAHTGDEPSTAWPSLGLGEEVVRKNTPCCARPADERFHDQLGHRGQVAAALHAPILAR